MQGPEQQQVEPAAAATTPGSGPDSDAAPTVPARSESAPASGATPTAEPAARGAGTPTSAPAPARLAEAVALDFAFGGRPFDEPVDVGAYPGSRHFVVERDGRVLLVDSSGRGGELLLDLTLQASLPTVGGEDGLLSVTLDPDFARNGYLYAYYTLDDPFRSRLARFTVEDDVASLDSQLTILDFAQLYVFHNGGAVRFGPDGMLYLSLGDAGDFNAQKLDTLLGAIVRIDVRQASAAKPYAVPADNPFIGVAGARPELWAYGLRNPWRISFDPATGELWAADVGGDLREEIDLIRPGGNYGWEVWEGDICKLPEVCNSEEFIAPVATYGHDQGCAVIGGAVYRGAAIPALQAHYIFGDLCSSTIWALPVDGGADPVLLATADSQILSVGVDADGEILVLGFSWPILRLVPPD